MRRAAIGSLVCTACLILVCASGATPGESNPGRDAVQRVRTILGLDGFGASLDLIVMSGTMQSSLTPSATGRWTLTLRGDEYYELDEDRPALGIYHVVIDHAIVRMASERSPALHSVMPEAEWALRATWSHYMLLLLLSSPRSCPVVPVLNGRFSLAFNGPCTRGTRMALGTATGFPLRLTFPVLQTRARLVNDGHGHRVVEKDSTESEGTLEAGDYRRVGTTLIPYRIVETMGSSQKTILITKAIVRPAQ